MAYRSWVSSDSRPKIGTQLKQPRPGDSALSVAFESVRFS